MSYESGSWVSPATSAYTEIAGALMENNGIDPNTGDPVSGGGGGLDANWKQIGTPGDDYAYLPDYDPNAGFRWLEGGGGNDTIQGGNGENVIYGGTGNDALGGGYCANILLGEDGRDSIYGGNLQDLALGGTGNDFLRGFDGSDYLMGDEGDDHIEGMNGDDYMQGGIGHDTLEGGTGNDFYYIDDTLDTIVELAYQGTDDVMVASINYSIADLVNIEHIGLYGEATQATGNAGNNIVQGNLTKSSKLFGLAGNDILYSEAGNDTHNGGSGKDSMHGGAGNDTYIIDNTGDVVVETVNAGVDTVQTSVSRTLGDNQENLVLLGSSMINGNGNRLKNDLTGNASANALKGMEGNDTMNGMGGGDTMEGGAGNDLYIVDSTGDVVIETANAGMDTVRSSVSRVLGDNQENLVLSGVGAINGTGNTLANSITGNASNNLLLGSAGHDSLTGASGKDTLIGALTNGARGAAEIDVLSGGAGADRFVLGIAGGRLYDDGNSSASGLGGYALITDFGNGADHLQLAGSASPQRYFLGNSPFSNPAGRALYHDSNANGILNPGTDELIAVIQGPAAENALSGVIYA